MPLPSSGAISFSQINVELGLASTTTISLNQTSVRTLFGVASGPISMNNGYGKANAFGLVYSANTSNVNVRTAALAAGWDGTSKLNVTINSGVVIFSTSTGSYAMTVSGSFPGGVEIINNGTILGRGGDGGSSTVNGGNGGPALLVQSAVTINNTSGRIAGGGGGGGGGAAYTYCVYQDEGVCYQYATEYGPGGGGGIGNGSGGSGGSWGSAGSAGTLTAAGSGGSPGGGGQANYVGPGGAGGTYGSTGGNGCNGSYGGGCGVPSGLGGAGGAAVVGNSNITWTATGTRNGSIS